METKIVWIECRLEEGGKTLYFYGHTIQHATVKAEEWAYEYGMHPLLIRDEEFFPKPKTVWVECRFVKKGQPFYFPGDIIKYAMARAKRWIRDYGFQNFLAPKEFLPKRKKLKRKHLLRKQIRHLISSR